VDGLPQFPNPHPGPLPKISSASRSEPQLDRVVLLDKAAEGGQSKGLRILARTFHVRAAQRGENAHFTDQPSDWATFTQRKSRLIGFHRLSAPPGRKRRANFTNPPTPALAGGAREGDCFPFGKAKISELCHPPPGTGHPISQTRAQTDCPKSENS
jgi:hypothetical protein